MNRYEDEIARRVSLAPPLSSHQLAELAEILEPAVEAAAKVASVLFRLEQFGTGQPQGTSAAVTATSGDETGSA